MARAFRKEGTLSSSAEAAARIHDIHGERDSQRLFSKYGLRLHVEPSSFQLEAAEGGQLPVTVPYLKVSSYLRSLVSRHPCVVFGGFETGEDAEALCATFWDKYQLFHPQHIIYSTYSAEERKRVLPICLHGDKGRGHGKNPVFVFSFESCFGLPRKVRLAGSRSDRAKERRASQKRVHGGRLSWTCRQRAQEHVAERLPTENNCSLKRRKLDNGKFVEALQHNSRGSTLLTRFLISAIPSKVFKANPKVVETLLEKIAEDLSVLFHEGIVLANKGVYKAAIVGVKGDYEFLVEAGSFERHYGHVGSRQELAMCPECHAGQPGLHYEDFSDHPPWSSTRYLTEPWSEEPAIMKVPFALSKRPQLFRRDMFHTLKYGFCRDLAAGLLILLGDLTYFDFTPTDSLSVDSRLERAYSLFSMWCAAEGRSTTLKKFSKASATFPWLGGKGADTVLCMMFLQVMAANFKRDARHPSHIPLLQAVEEILLGGLDFLGVMHSHDLFLPASCARFMFRSGLKLLRGYAFLASFCLQRGMKLFSLRPKTHYFHHTLMEMEEQLAAGHKWILSPAIFNCESNEDYIGRISRLSRKVSPKICSQRVIDRYLVGMYLALKRAGV